MGSMWMPSTSGLSHAHQIGTMWKLYQKGTCIHDQQVRVKASLQEPVNPSNQGAGRSSQVVKSGASAVLQQASGSVEEALSSHAAHLEKAREKERLRREMVPLHQLRQGGFAENSLMYRQIFVIRSYEVGPDKCTSVREVFSLFQEMALNHVQLLGIAGDGFGATRAMNRLGLIWVVTRMRVDVERYPVWPEVIEIDSWVASAGKNGMRRDWVMRAYKTGEVLARATSTWCMMHDTTRRLARIPGEVRSEIEPNFMDHRSAFSHDESTAARITKLDDGSTHHRTSHLTSTPADLDMNQHVNNLKYVNWVLESIPTEHVQTHQLASIVLEYRRECHSSDVVESLTSSKSVLDSACQYSHLLRTQGAGRQEILRGKTTWQARTSRADNPPV